MKKKLPWLKYDMEKAKYMEAKERETDARKKLDEAAKTLNDLREPIEYDDLVYPIVQCLIRAIIVHLYEVLGSKHHPKVLLVKKIRTIVHFIKYLLHHISKEKLLLCVIIDMLT